MAEHETGVRSATVEETTAAEEPRALTMPPMVLYATKRPAFLLARARTVANNRTDWWGKIALLLDADVAGGVPRVDERWVNFTVLTRLDGVDYGSVPTLPGRDDQ